MDSAFNPATGAWEWAWPERISQHDLVYLSPPVDPMQGIPLGNGDVGALLWCEPSRIVIAVNKCDLWDDAPFERFHNWISSEEDRSTSLRQAGRLILDFGVPLLDPFYLTEFESRLDLASAQVVIHAATPFGKMNFRAYVSAHENVFVVQCESIIPEKVSHKVVLERWGSRTFSHWYAKVRRDPTIGLAGTRAMTGKDDIMLVHELTSGEFAVACRVAAPDGVTITPTRRHSRAADYEIASDSAQKEWTLKLAVTSPLAKGKAPRAARALLAPKDESRRFAAHCAYWKTFWNRSSLHIPDDYLENLWHLTMYYAASSQRGASPATFVNGLWGWNRDVHPWNFYFHWNQQMFYWPLLAAGHADLLLPYLNYRAASLPHAIRDARDWFGVEGAFISDVADRRGGNDVHTRDNHTPVAQIALDFWRYYRFTGDKAFLGEKGFPFMRLAAQFFASLLEKKDDGFYHAKSGTVYEGSVPCADAITELSMAKALFRSVLAAARELNLDLGGQAQVWQEVADHLAPLLTVTAPDAVISSSGGTLMLKAGAFRGSAVPSCELLAAGRRLSDGKILTSRNYTVETDAAKMVEAKDKIVQLSAWNKAIPLVQTALVSRCRYPVLPLAGDIFPAAEFCPVFPAEICGLNDRDSALFKSCVATAKAGSPEYIGWEPTPIVLARLGLAEETMALLEERPDKWQMYCNGFWRANSEETSKLEGLFFFGVNRVVDASRPESDQDNIPEDAKFPCASWPYRHMECEPMGILACAINEMLLQSHESVIRIAPAFKWDASFSLHAVGGFVVSAEIKDGAVLWVAIQSQLGHPCKMENPWEPGQAHIFRNGDRLDSFTGRTISFDTAAGATYILAPDKDAVKNWRVQPKTFRRNPAPKKSKGGIASLGLPRMF